MCWQGELSCWLAAAALADGLEQAYLPCPFFPQLGQARLAGRGQSGIMCSDFPQQKHLPRIISLLFNSSLEGVLLWLEFPPPAAPLDGLASVLPMLFPREAVEAVAGRFMSASCFFAWS